MENVRTLAPFRAVSHRTGGAKLRRGTAMIVVHHLEDSRSQRILWLLEELGQPYEVRRYARDPNTRLAPRELLAVHPLGKSPVITDDGRVVAETGAIVEYLVDRYGNGRLKPAQGTDEQLAYTYWLHFAEGSAMPPATMKLVFDMLPARAPLLIRPIAAMMGKAVDVQYLAPTIARQMAFVDETLGRSPWFAGPAFSAADVMMSFPLEATAARSGLRGLPKIAAWLETIHARPAYQRALEQGGPYALAGA
jgi:glutathione S-transferase